MIVTLAWYFLCWFPRFFLVICWDTGRVTFIIYVTINFLLRPPFLRLSHIQLKLSLELRKKLFENFLPPIRKINLTFHRSRSVELQQIKNTNKP